MQALLPLQQKPSNLHDQTEKQDMEVCRLESRLMALENEQKKIDAFKRELPLCMQLLCEAIEASKEQLSLHHSLAHKQFKRPIICSFDNRTSDVQSDNAGSEPLVRGKPLNSACAHRNEGEHSAKKHCNYVIGNDAYQWINIWDPRAELSTSYPAGNGSSVTAEKGARLYMSEQAFSSSATPNICSKQKLGGAFAPFSRNSQLVQPTARPGAINPADLSLKCPESGISMSPTSCRSVQKKAESRDGLELSVCTKSENSKQQVQEVASKERKTESDASDGIQLSRRKTRRSWSPDLHQLFVDALQKLGGAQATPKQIRELMNIEGLTNDEVKSHLQKYRLHTKRLSSSPLTSASQTPPCVVPVPRAWTPLEYASLHSNNTASRQSQSCETFETQENVVELGSSGQLSSLVSRCWVKELPRCSRQHVGNQSGRCFKLSDVGGEESVGEAVKPEIPGLKHHRHPGVELDESDEIEDHSSNYHQTCSFGEDDKDYEDSPKEI